MNLFAKPLIGSDVIGFIGCLGAAFDHWGGLAVIFAAYLIAWIESREEKRAHERRPPRRRTGHP
jgi:hypothetical protein